MLIRLWRILCKSMLFQVISLAVGAEVRLPPKPSSAAIARSMKAIQMLPLENGLNEVSSSLPSSAPAKSASEAEESEEAEEEDEADQYDNVSETKEHQTAEALDLGADTSKRNSSHTDFTRQPSMAASQSVLESTSLHSEDAYDQSEAEEGSSSEEEEEESQEEEPDLAEGTLSNDPSEEVEVAKAGARQKYAGQEDPEEQEGSDAAEEEADSEANEEADEEEESEGGGDAELQPESNSESDAQSEEGEESEEEEGSEVGSEEGEASAPARDLLAELDEVADPHASQIQKPDKQQLQEPEPEVAAAPSLEQEDVIILGDTPPVKCR